MEQYVTIDKHSKKAQKEYYSKQRRTWGELNPVTRSVPSGKIYNRNRDKQERRRIGREFSNGFDADFCVLVIESCKYLKLIFEFLDGHFANNIYAKKYHILTLAYIEKVGFLC